MPPITPSISTAGHDQAELTGVIKARLGQVGVPASLCGAIATDIVETAGFDTPEAIRDMEEGQLQRAGVKEGHLKRVCRALFNDAEQPWAPVTPELAAAQPPAAAPPEAVVTKDAEFTCPLPAKEPTPEELTDIGLALRAHLRKQGDESWIAALEDIVANLPRFKHVVIANKQSQGFNAMSLRKAIGKEADLAHADATSRKGPIWRT